MAELLVIRIHEAEGLQNVAWFGMNQDPYVIVRALPSGTEVKTGSIWGGGTKPKWDPSKHNSHLVMRVAPGDHSLVFEIKNKNQMMSDELIGSAVMDMAVLTDSEDQAAPLNLTLQTGGGTLLATAFRRTSADDADLAEALARSMQGSSGGGGGGGRSSGSSSGKRGSSGSSGGGGGGSRSKNGPGHTLGGGTTPQSAEERRAAVVAAAEARQGNWRQGGAAGGAADPAKQQALVERRQKDELIGRIEAAYKSRGQDPPFGLAASSLEALQKHLASVTNSNQHASAKQKKEAQVLTAAGLN